MVLDSLASIGNFSLQRSSVSIASHWDRKRCLAGNSRASEYRLIAELVPSFLCQKASYGPLAFER
jgi:hypothetical protein